MSEAPQLLSIDFPYSGPWGGEMSRAFDGLARDIAAESGLLWKVWTENRELGRAGGVYLFADGQAREAYLAKHTARLKAFGIEGIAVQRFEANPQLSAITRAAVA